MLRGYLISEKDGQRVPVQRALIVGRAQDCALTVDDPMASRRHLEVLAGEQGAFSWKDLGSSNGTLHNGAQADEGALEPGDHLQIGQVLLRFEVEELAEAPTVREEPRLFQETILDQQGIEQPAPSGGRESELLEAVYAVVNEIASNYDPCSLMDSILQTTLRAIAGERGAIFLAGPGESLLPCPVCNKVHRITGGRLQPAEPGEIQISSTVAGRVLRKGESVLFEDADTGALANAQSVFALSLRSILCAPLRTKKGILGILYIDTSQAGMRFSHEDMLLASAVGNSAGLALENARMQQDMLEKQRIEQEISTAWTIQEGFLIKDWGQADKRFEVYGETRPAKTVGGDFYDFVQPNPDTVGLLIGDVSGKGVPAALTMAQSLAQFRLHAREIASPADLLRQLNADLNERSRRGLFCSLCYVTIDLNTGRMVAANAGHSPLLLLGQDGGTFLAPASGPPAGILPEIAVVDVTHTLAPGETVLLYTDGILEARSTTTLVDAASAEPNEFGEEGLLRAAEPRFGAGPRALLDAINEQAQRFCAPLAPHDDCTMIALRYLPQGAPGTESTGDGQ